MDEGKYESADDVKRLLRSLEESPCLCPASISPLRATQQPTECCSCYEVRRKLQMTTIKEGEQFVPVLFSNNIDFSSERRLRIWQEFWDALLLQDEELRIPCDLAVEEMNRQHPNRKPDYKPIALNWIPEFGVPPMLQSFDGSVAERHLENKEIYRVEGPDAYALALTQLYDLQTMGSEAGVLRQILAHLVMELAGPDVYWMDSSNRGEFGALHVIPFPITAVWISDSSTERRVVFSIMPTTRGQPNENRSIDRIFQIIQLNRQPEVLKQRAVRQHLRAMHDVMIQKPLTVGDLALLLSLGFGG